MESSEDGLERAEVTSDVDADVDAIHGHEETLTMPSVDGAEVLQLAPDGASDAPTSGVTFLDVPVASPPPAIERMLPPRMRQRADTITAVAKTKDDVIAEAVAAMKEQGISRTALEALHVAEELVKCDTAREDALTRKLWTLLYGPDGCPSTVPRERNTMSSAAELSPTHRGMAHPLGDLFPTKRRSGSMYRAPEPFTLSSFTAFDIPTIEIKDDAMSESTERRTPTADTLRKPLHFIHHKPRQFPLIENTKDLIASLGMAESLSLTKKSPPQRRLTPCRRSATPSRTDRKASFAATPLPPIPPDSFEASKALYDHSEHSYMKTLGSYTIAKREYFVAADWDRHYSAMSTGQRRHRRLRASGRTSAGCYIIDEDEERAMRHMVLDAAASTTRAEASGLFAMPVAVTPTLESFIPSHAQPRRTHASATVERDHTLSISPSRSISRASSAASHSPAQAIRQRWSHLFGAPCDSA